MSQDKNTHNMRHCHCQTQLTTNTAKVKHATEFWEGSQCLIWSHYSCEGVEKMAEASTRSSNTSSISIKPVVKIPTTEREPDRRKPSRLMSVSIAMETVDEPMASLPIGPTRFRGLCRSFRSFKISNRGAIPWMSEWRNDSRSSLHHPESIYDPPCFSVRILEPDQP